jgi:hypothetical protein
MSKILSSESNKNLNIFRCTSPYAVFITKNPDDETSEHIINSQERFLRLSESVKSKLASEETAKMIQAIGQNFNLELLQMADIARAIRDYYFGEIQLNDFSAILSQEMEIDLVVAQKISDLVIQKIINDDSQEKAYQAKIEKLPITIALEKYTELGEQLITSRHINLKIFPEPVRPSIKNWLSDYTFTIGISNHDPIVRGDYLFRNENTRTLSETDREKLTSIIDSFENKTPLTVNTGTKQVIFSLPEKKVIPQSQVLKRPPFRPNFRNNEPEPAEIRRGQENYYSTQKASQPEQKFQTDEARISAWRRDLPREETLGKENEAENIRFSSPQTLSTEKPSETPRSISQNKPTWQTVSKINYSAPKRPIPKNVLDLREE